MADVKKPSIASSVSYKIGGKEYSAKDVSQFKSSQTGNAKTGSEISHESAKKIQSQTENFYKNDSNLIKSGIESEVQNTPRTVERIKTGEEAQVPQNTPYRPQVQTQQPQTVKNGIPQPGNSSPTPPQSTTGNVKTQSSISREAEQKVQSQTESYHKTGAYETAKSGIQSETVNTPRTVESIKTGGSPAPEQHSTYKPQVPGGTAYQPQTVKSGISQPGNSSPTPPQSTTGNVKTQSSISREAEQKVQSQTESYHKTGAYETAKSGIQSEMVSTPRTVESIKTGGSPAPEQHSTYKPQVPGGTAYQPQATGAFRPMGNTTYVDTGNVKTQSSISREAEQKVQSQTNSYNKSGAYNTPQPTIRDRVDSTPMNLSGVQTGISRTPQGSHFSLFNVINSTNGKSFNLENAINKVGGNAQSALSQQADLGAESAGMGVTAGLVGVQAFRASQKFTEAAPAIAQSTVNGLHTAGKGVYQVAVTGGLAVVTVSRTAAMVQAGQFHPLSHASMQMLKAQALAVGLNKTALSQTIIHSVTGIHNRIQNGIQSAKQIGNTIQTGYHTVQRGVKIVRGVTNGTISAQVAAQSVSRMANKAIKFSVGGIKTGVSVGLKTGKGLIVKGVTKGIPFVALKGIPKTASFMHGGGLTLAGIMQGSDDWAIRGTGTAIKVTDIGVRTAVKGAKATGYTIKTAVKGGMTAGRASIAAGRFIKNQGLKAAWNAGRKKAATAIANAGRSMVTAIINAAKALGSKILIPILIVVIVIMGFNGIVMVPVTAVSSIFSSMFSTSDTKMDYDVREYLNTLVPGLSTDFQQDLANQMQASQGTYDIVRFYSNTGSGEVVEPTLSGVASVVPTIDEILNMIQPIFNAVVLMQYELEPTEAEAEALTEEIFSKLFSVTTATSTEYCGQNIETGEGTANAAHSCGSIHALSDCPNPITGIHSSYTCSDCCYNFCPGHEETCSEPDCEGHTTYCSGCEHDCSGYTYCGSHSVISYTLSVDGIYRLEAEYFLDPIEQLSNIPNRTEDEEAQLQELKDYHEIFLEMMSQVSVNYGGGMSMADLSGVVFINGTRNSCQAVIDLALSQVGQTGGQPYWSYYGFSSRVEWCACFVHWCMRNTPSASGSYPQTANNAYCQTIADNFMSIGQWGSRGYTDLVAGDTIFFDWQGDGHTDHIGLVIGTDGTNVYTVEGNSGDAVKVKSYPINSSVIYGYGLMNF